MGLGRLIGPGIPGLGVVGRPLRVNELRPFPGVLLGQQALNGHVDVLGVGHEGLPVNEGQLFGLHHQVDALGGIAAQALQVKLLHQVQFLEQDVAAGVGGRFVNGVAVISDADGFLPAGPAICQVLQGQDAALLLAEPDNSSGDFALVEGLPPAIHDSLKSAGQVLLVADFPGLQWSPAIGGKYGLGSRELAQQGIGGNGSGQDVGYRETVGRQVNGRGKALGQGQKAVLLVDIQPAIDQPRHRHGHNSLHWNALGQVPFPRGGIGSGAGSVAYLQQVRILAVDHDEPVTAHAGHEGLHHVQGRRRCQGRVSKVAAPLQHGNAGLGGQGMPGADHTIPPHNNGAVGVVAYAVGGVGHYGASLLVGLRLGGSVCSLASM